MSEIGFKSYVYKGMSISPEDVKIIGQIEAQKMYFVNTDNIKILPKSAKRTTIRSVLREIKGRLKLAYGVLRYGADYLD